LTNWGRWGSEDEIGALNLVSPAKSLKALTLARTGVVYSLAQRLQAQGVPMITEGIRPVHLMTVDGGDAAAGAASRFGHFSAEDYLALRIHGNTTHIDALGHTWKDGQIYNGFSSNSIKSSGMERCGIQNVPSIVTRGVLLDVAGRHGAEYLPDGYAIAVDDLESCAETSIEAGDAVIIRTGWYRLFAKDPQRYAATRPGLSVEAAAWLAERDVVLVGCDNIGIEVRPYPVGSAAPVHDLLLRDCGIYMLELMMLEEIAAAGLREFLFVVAPLKLTGGTGSPVNPLAIV
jgi:kynurenine formamidase